MHREPILYSAGLDAPGPHDRDELVDELVGTGDSPSIVHTLGITQQVPAAPSEIAVRPFVGGPGGETAPRQGVSGTQVVRPRSAREAGLRAGSILYRQALADTLPPDQAAELLAPSGQIVMPWGPAQLALDGLAYAVGTPRHDEADAETEAATETEPIRDRQLWLEGLEQETLFARRKQASRHRRAAARAELDGNASLRVWHADRERGQLERFDRIRACGNRTLVRTLQCGCRVGAWQQHIPLGCSDWKACPFCRSKRVRKYKAKFRASRKYWRRQYRFALRAGKYSERFLTLTLPHVGTVSERMRAIKSAWTHFCRMLKAHFLIDKNLPENQKNFPWLAVEETTPGWDGTGHPHLHSWMLSPYVHQALLRLYWARSLPAHYQQALPQRPIEDVLLEHRRGVYERQRRKGGTEKEWRARAAKQWRRERSELLDWLVTRRGEHGRLLDTVPWPVLDIRRAQDAEDELIKYLCKEMYTDPSSGELVYMDPVLGAEIYESYMGMRALWTSRGFWQEWKSPAHCPRCGSCDWHTEIVDELDRHHSRGSARWDTS